MAENVFKKYIWLINILIRGKKLTYEQINNLWFIKTNKNLPKRTFHNHIDAIQELFDINIECEKPSYKYYIENLEDLKKNQFILGIINSYSLLNQLNEDTLAKKHIITENHNAGEIHLASFLEAINRQHKIEIEHQGFETDDNHTLIIEPYYLKLYNGRWYVIGKNKENDEIRIYGLDRIKSCSITEEQYKIPTSFKIEDYFQGCYGIFRDEQVKPEKIIIKAFGTTRKYIETKPLHQSQKIISSDETSTTFRYYIKPTYDFLRDIIRISDEVKVIEPKKVREDVKNMANKILSYYDND